MPTPPTLILDGTQRYGVTVGSSGVLTIGGVAYKASNVNITRNFQEAKDYVPSGAPGRKRLTQDFDTGTMELQLATSTTVFPSFGQSFTMEFDSNYGVETWYIGQMTTVQSNSAGEIQVVSVEIHKAYNGTPIPVT